LSNSARKATTVGEMVNLMSVDTEKIVQAFIGMHFLWSAPLVLCVAVYFQILTLRTEELSLLRRASLLSAATYSMWYLSPFLVTLLDFITYTLTSDSAVLDPQTAFTMILLIQAQNFQLTIVPQAVMWVIQVGIAISLTIESGILVGIVGHVGSGKSSLIAALLGEMEKLTGNVIINGSIAYVPQQAWIQNLTLRENVLFARSL
ncbi:hypothetical protein LSH36_1431g00011, partial [Paralvinella palmiformis]